MPTLSKPALGRFGHIKPLLPAGNSTSLWELLARSLIGGMPPMSTLSSWQALRAFAQQPLPEQVLSDLLGAAAGIDRHEPKPHALRLVVASDGRRVTIHQDCVDTAALDLVYVADPARMKRVHAGQPEADAHATVGATAQNAGVYGALEGRATVIRPWFVRDALARDRAASR